MKNTINLSEYGHGFFQDIKGFMKEGKPLNSSIENSNIIVATNDKRQEAGLLLC
jgi:hypothetical protein